MSIGVQPFKKQNIGNKKKSCQPSIKETQETRDKHSSLVIEGKEVRTEINKTGWLSPV